MKKTVGHLRNAIAAQEKKRINCASSQLLLYIAETNCTWLANSKETARRLEKVTDDIKAMLTDANKMGSTSSLQQALIDEKKMPMPQFNQIHVLVVPPEYASLEAHEGGDLSTLQLQKMAVGMNERVLASLEPPMKKLKLDQSAINYQGWLGSRHISVPLETIGALQQIKKGFSYPDATFDRPLFLLYGPPMFGKTTTVHRVAEWIKDDACVADVKCIRIVLNQFNVKDEESFWNELALYIDRHSSCADEDCFVKLATRDQKRFCLIVDEMDRISENKNLAIKFLAILHRWKSAPYFCGFLGIGSHGLLHDYMTCKEDRIREHFSEVTLIPAQPFSDMQMRAFFKLIESRFPFPETLQRGIMKYSSGTPGVFGSMVGFALEMKTSHFEWLDWEPWFKLDVFWVYCSDYHFSDSRIQETLSELSESEWEPLIFMLQNDGMLTESDVDEECRMPVDEGEHLADRFLKMGVIITGN